MLNTVRKVRDMQIAELERAKKAKRDEKLLAMDAKSQKTFLEKEREKEMRKGQKKQTMRA